MRKLVRIGVCAVYSARLRLHHMPTIGNAKEDGEGVRAGRNTVGFGDRAGGGNYYCQPGVCQSTGMHDPDYRVCLGGSAPPSR